MNENASVSWVDIVNIPTGYTGVLTWTYTTTMDTYGFVLDFDTRNSTSGDMALGRIKLERGNKSTDWTPAPEDLESSISFVNTALTNYINTNDAALAAVKDQADKSFDTWFYSGQPTANNAPANTWTDNATKALHVGDMYYDTATGKAYTYNSSYQWVAQSSSNIASTDAITAAQTLANSKIKTYAVAAKPTSGMSSGDLWIDTDDNNRMYRYNGSTWVDIQTEINVGGRNLAWNSKLLNIQNGQANKYISKRRGADILVTRDDGFGEIHCYGSSFGGISIYSSQFDFQVGDVLTLSFYAKYVGNLNTPYISFYPMMYKNGSRNTSILIPIGFDGNPYVNMNARRWTNKDGSYRNLTTSYEKYYVTFVWTQEIADLDYVEISAQALASWTDTSSNSYVSIYMPKLEKGNVATDWTPAPEDTEAAIANLTELTDSLQNQIDSKIETWTQVADPATGWNTDVLKESHVGDLWYYIGETTTNPSRENNSTYKYTLSNGTYSWVKYVSGTDMTGVFDKIDGKSTIFYGTTTGTYTGVQKDDYLVDSTTGNTYKYDPTVTTNNHWVEVTNYKTGIDEAKQDVVDLDTSLNQQEVFNRLTNNQANQGIYLDNGNVYVNATYIKSGEINADLITTGKINADLITTGHMSASRIKGDTLTLGGNNNVNGSLSILNGNSDVVGTWNNTGINAVAGKIGGWTINESYIYNPLNYEDKNYQVALFSPNNMTSGTNAFFVRYNYPSKNLYIISKQTSGYIAANGTIATASDTYLEKTSAYIAVTENSPYVFQVWCPDLTSSQQMWMGYQFYSDTSGTLVGSRTAKTGTAGNTYLAYTDIVAPSGAKYIKVSYRTFGNGHAKLEQTTTVNDWTPAVEDEGLPYSNDFAYPFYIKYNGKLFASNAEIRGDIDAKSGSIAGFSISSTANRGTTANGGHPYTRELYKTSSDGTHDYVVGMKADSGNATLNFYVKQIDTGKTWEDANVKNLFWVNNNGKLYATNIQVTLDGSTSTVKNLKASSLTSGNLDASKVTITGSLNIKPGGGASLELYGEQPYIDFHFNNSTADLTARIIEGVKNELHFVKNAASTSYMTVKGVFSNQSSRNVKRNIIDISDDDAKKLYDIKPVSFDYKWGQHGFGMIAEDVCEVLPELVTIPDDYNADTYEYKNLYDSVPSLHYQDFIPYIIKLLQVQHKEIQGLKEIIEK